MIRYVADHIHLFTSDVKATAHWYRDKLGAEIIESRQSDGQCRLDIRLGSLQLYLADGPRIEAELGEQLAPHPTGLHYGLDHVGLRVDNVHEAIVELRGRGVKVVFGPRALRPGVIVAYIEAPDGVPIEILSRDLSLDARPVAVSQFILKEANI